MAKGRIPESDIEEIRNQVRIEDVVGEYVSLQPAGVDSLKGLSPFTDEKTPSFHVRPNHGYYHCFSTGEGGDVFSFLMKMEHISFVEAVEQLADRIGYRINYQGGGSTTPQQRGTRRRLLQANAAAHKFYQEQLETPEAQDARDMLLQRGFDEALIKEFTCGYAPAGWDTVTRHLQKQGFTFEELEAAGISKMGSRGTPIDRFHRRLIWPISIPSGEVVGFGARKLYDDDKLGKYMNTPETMLYKKSKVLFGLDKAKKYIAESHQCVVVEGYTDVMAMWAAGVKTAVAACGTAFGDEHLAILRRFLMDDNYYRGEIIYTFDGDEAGQKAAMRAFTGDQQFAGQKFVCIAPGGMDPCELRQAEGDVAVRDLIARRIPMFEFALRSLLKEFDLSIPEGRVAALARLVPVVADIRDSALRDEYARQLAGWLGWSDTTEIVNRVRKEARYGKRQQSRGARQGHSRQTQLRAPQSQGNSSGDASSRFGETVSASSGQNKPRIIRPRKPLEGSEEGRQRAAVRLAIQYPKTAGAGFDALGSDAFTYPLYRTIRDAIEASGGCTNAVVDHNWVPTIQGHIDDLVAQGVVSELAVEAIPVDQEHIVSYAEGLFARLEEVWVGQQVAVLKAALQRKNPASDPEYQDMFKDLVALEEYRRTLKQVAIETF